MARKTKVRTTINPGTVIAVDSAELVDLERNKLIHSRELADGEAPRKGEKAWESDDVEPVDSGVITDAAPTKPEAPAKGTDKKGSGK